MNFQSNSLDFNLPTKCTLCGEQKFTFLEVLWEELVEEWELSKYEENYINHQQGFLCQNCNSNLRIMTLAKKILDYYNFKQHFEVFINTDLFNDLNILEIGDTGSLKNFIDFVDGYKHTEFSPIGLLAKKDNSFDFVVHSDVLEHIPDPLVAIKECYRVLTKEGVMFFTIPLIVDRPSRNRKNLTKSYHLPDSEDDETQLVHTEFGHDFWKLLFEAGFKQIQLSAITYPCSIAISVRK